MEIKLALVDIKDRKALVDLIKDYQKEILKTENPEEYKYLDSYWQKPDRYPYFINVDSKVVGFVLVNDHALLKEGAKNIAEFYIKQEFRKLGIGKLSAKKVFDLFPGKWEVRELEENIPARIFWRNVISEYTNGNYQETTINNNKWNGPVQTFNSLS